MISGGDSGPAGTPVERTREVCWLVEAAAKRALEKTGEKNLTTSIAVEVGKDGSNVGEVAISLVAQSQRKVTSRGFTAEELGKRIRHSFYGAEALRQPRGREEVRVMVRTPESERRSEEALENLILQIPGGGEIPLTEAARIIRSTSPLRIQRVNGGRVIRITSNVTAGVTTGNKVLSSLEQRELPKILNQFPGLSYTFEGEQREQRDAMQRLGWGLLAAIFAVFAIMAALLRSYLQSFIILLSIPFSLAGAVVGHIVLGSDISIFSIFGMIALCGMVVNGGFVLAVTRERFLADGMPIERITREAAARRSRPILLTALTTFLGLAPMIFETSIQALFLVPMAISLGVGTLASAIVVLLVIPAAFTLTETIPAFDADGTVERD